MPNRYYVYLVYLVTAYIRSVRMREVSERVSAPTSIGILWSTQTSWGKKKKSVSNCSWFLFKFFAPRTEKGWELGLFLVFVQPFS